MLDLVIPAYRNDALLQRAVESVVAQTSSDWHLHVLDDASPGRTMHDFVTGLEHPRISYLRNEANQGINAQFNRALATGTSPYVVIMGDDDEMHPEYVDYVSSVLTSFPRAAAVQPGVVVIDGSGAASLPLGDRVKGWLAPRPTSPTAYGGEDLLVSLLRGNWCYFPSICWRRDAVATIGFRPEYDVVLDLALLTEVVRRGGELVVAPRPVFRYRRHDASLSSTQAVDGRRFDEERDFFEAAARQLTAAGLPVAARAARQHLTSRLHALVRLRDALRTGDRDAARRLLRHATRPGGPRS